MSAYTVAFFSAQGFYRCVMCAAKFAVYDAMTTTVKSVNATLKNFPPFVFGIQKFAPVSEEKAR